MDSPSSSSPSAFTPNCHSSPDNGHRNNDGRTHDSIAPFCANTARNIDQKDKHFYPSDIKDSSKNHFSLTPSTTLSASQSPPKPSSQSSVLYLLSSPTSARRSLHRAVILPAMQNTTEVGEYHNNTANINNNYTNSTTNHTDTNTALIPTDHMRVEDSDEVDDALSSSSSPFKSPTRCSAGGSNSKVFYTLLPSAVALSQAPPTAEKLSFTDYPFTAKPPVGKRQRFECFENFEQNSRNFLTKLVIVGIMVSAAIFVLLSLSYLFLQANANGKFFKTHFHFLFNFYFFLKMKNEISISSDTKLSEELI